MKELLDLKIEQYNLTFQKPDCIVLSDVAKLNFNSLGIEVLRGKDVAIIVLDGSLKYDDFPLGLELTENVTTKTGFTAFKYSTNKELHDREKRFYPNSVTLIHLDHHADSKTYPNQVVQLERSLDEILELIGEHKNIVLATPRPDSDSISSLYRFWIAYVLKCFNEENSLDKITNARINYFKAVLAEQAQWGDTFDFSENASKNFSSTELSDIRILAKYLNRLNKDSEGIEKGLKIVEDVLINILNGFKVDLPLEYKQEYFKIMGREQALVDEICNLWKSNPESQELYETKHLLYLDISTLEHRIQTEQNQSGYSIDAELVANAIIKLNLTEPVYPYVIIKRSRNTEKDYYSFSCLVGHQKNQQFLNLNLGTDILSALNKAEEITREQLLSKIIVKSSNISKIIKSSKISKIIKTPANINELLLDNPEQAKQIFANINLLGDIIVEANDFKNALTNKFGGKNEASGSPRDGTYLSLNEISEILSEVLENHPVLKAVFNQASLSKNSIFGPYRNPVN